MIKRLFLSSFLSICLLQVIGYSGEADNVLKTRYTAIHYTQDQDLNDFIWHINGRKAEASSDIREGAKSIDRIVERVEDILEIRPRNFKVKIYLQRGPLEENKIAVYDNKTKSIRISIDQATDGVLAHEIAHAVIYQHFPTPPPSKAQEYLTQHVDKELWRDY
ncbi:MAG: hypothetical protein PHP46_06505 [Candidatus Omnitrophica bacterium]|nr:hypothetical protein [Candidatus Omnitrophota bacterium]